MKSLFDRYKLTTYERRFAVFFGLALLAIVHVSLIHDQLGLWSEYQDKIRERENTLELRQGKLDQEQALRRKLESLEESYANRITADYNIFGFMQEKVREISRASGFPNSGLKQPLQGGDDAEELAYRKRTFRIVEEADAVSLLNFLISLSSDDWVICVDFIDLKKAKRSDILQCNMNLTVYYQVQPSAEAGAEQ